MNLYYLVLSDIHLGHNINKTDNIITNLKFFFITYHKQFKNLNMIFLAGDIFDKLLVNSGNDYIQAMNWLTYLVRYCQKHNITLRVLEGTPSHDWKQMSAFSNIINDLNISVDYKYIDTLYIEYITKFNLYVLYIPDEYKNNAKDTYKEVKKLLEKMNLKQVDIAIMHGQFNYQLPIKLDSSHNEEDYLGIVKYFINIGHIHTHSVRGRIIAQGSFDRLAHGEEENKGGVLIHLSDTNQSWWFLNNDKAMIFKTYNIEDNNLEAIVKYLDKELKQYPVNSNIRLIIKDDEFIIKNATSLKMRYHRVNLKIQKSKQVEEIKQKIIEEEVMINSFNITKDNIEELMDKEMEKFNLSSEEMKLYKQELHKVI